MEVPFENVRDEIVEAAVDYLNDEDVNGRLEIEEEGDSLRITWVTFEPDDPDEFDPTVVGKSSGTFHTYGTKVSKEKAREIAEERDLI